MDQSRREWFALVASQVLALGNARGQVLDPLVIKLVREYRDTFLLALSPDGYLGCVAEGAFLSPGAPKKTIKLIDVTSGRVILRGELVGDLIEANFSGDGKYLYARTVSSHLLWSLSSLRVDAFPEIALTVSLIEHNVGLGTANTTVESTIFT